jgi:hypothetical protein
MAKFAVVCKLESVVVIEADTSDDAIAKWEQKQEECVLSLDHYIQSYGDPYTVNLIDTARADF